MGNDNVAWACLNCGDLTYHPNVSKEVNIEIRKTTLCFECYRALSPEKAKSYRLQAISHYRG